MEDRIGLNLRRHQVALRMIAHRARRRTIVNFTGLTRERIKTLRREWNVRSKGRRRGPSPTSLSTFFREEMRDEVAVVALFLKIYGAMSSERIPRAANVYPNLDRGERLCEVYEAYRTYLPESEVTFELIVLLAIELAEPDSLEMRRCLTCPRLIVLEILSLRHRHCPQCEEAEEERLKGAARHGRSARKQRNDPAVGHQEQHAADGEDKHAPEGEVRQVRKLEEKRRQQTQHRDRRDHDLGQRPKR